MLVHVNGYTLLINYRLLDDLLFNSYLLTNWLSFSYAHTGISQLKEAIHSEGFMFTLGCYWEPRLFFLQHFCFKIQEVQHHSLHSRILIRTRRREAIHWALKWQKYIVPFHTPCRLQGYMIINNGFHQDKGKKKRHEIQQLNEKSANTGGQACSISLSKGGYLFASGQLNYKVIYC